MEEGRLGGSTYEMQALRGRENAAGDQQEEMHLTKADQIFSDQIKVDQGSLFCNCNKFMIVLV